MDSPFSDVIKQGAGMAIGGLSALASIKGGGLLNYMMNRERMMNDPSFRAGLQGSPFAAGVLGITGSRQPIAQPGQGMPAAGGVVAPEDMQPGFVGPAAPSGAPQTPPPTVSPVAGYVPGYVPGQPREWQPNLPPYSPEQQVTEAARVSALQGMQSQDTAQRAANKVAAGIIPSPAETDELVRRGVDLRTKAGVGSTVQVPIPGMRLDIGSPYTIQTPSEYSTYGEAAANRKPNEQTIQTGRGTFENAPVGPPAQAPAPAVAPAPAAATTPAPATAPAATAPAGRGGGITAPPVVVPPPTPARPAPPPRAAAPAPPPRQPPVQTGTPSPGAGYYQLPTPPPPAPEYPGAPLAPDASSSRPVYRQPEPAYPSPAPTPEEEAPTGIIGRVESYLAPRAAAAAEVPGWAPPPPARAAPVPAPARPPAAVPGWGPPPDTSIPAGPVVPPQTQIISPALPATPRPAGTEGSAVAPGMPAGTEAPRLSRRTITSATGQTDVYEFGPLNEIEADAAAAGIKDFQKASPEQIAYFNQLRVARQEREQIAGEDIRRTRRGLTESEQHAADYLQGKHDALNQFYEDFPRPEDRDPYIGWITRPWLYWASKLRDDPKFKAFVDDLSPFASMNEKGNRPPEGSGIDAGKVPTGYEDYSTQFEKRLSDFTFDLNAAMYRQDALRTIPSGELTPTWRNLVDSYFARIRAERNADIAAAQQGQQGGETPPTVTVPSTTTTTQPGQSFQGVQIYRNVPAQ